MAAIGQIDKFVYFECIVSSLIEWYKSVMGEGYSEEKMEEHFSRIVVLKLLFFVAAVKNKEGKDLLDVFDNFYAMQYGPVEGNIYTEIVNETGRIEHFRFPVSPTPKLVIYRKQEIETSDQCREEVDSAIVSLREKNKKLITYSGVELIKLSHRWMCWRVAIRLARLHGINCEKMASKDIREAEPYFE